MNERPPGDRLPPALILLAPLRVGDTAGRPGLRCLILLPFLPPVRALFPRVTEARRVPFFTVVLALPPRETDPRRDPLCPLTLLPFEVLVPTEEEPDLLPVDDGERTPVGRSLPSVRPR